MEGASTHCQEFFSWNAIDQQPEWSPGNYFIAIPYTPTLLFRYYSSHTKILFPSRHPQYHFYYFNAISFTTTTIPPLCSFDINTTIYNAYYHSTILIQLHTSTSTRTQHCTVHNSAPPSLYIAFPSYLLERMLVRITRRTLVQRHS